MSDQIIGTKPKFVPVYHYGASVAPKRVAYLVEVTIIATGETWRCCDSTHGHKTKANAAACFRKSWRRYYESVVSA